MDQYEQDIRVAIDELRLRFSYCDSDYNQLQTKFFALLAGEVAIATFLLADNQEFHRVFTSGSIIMQLFFVGGLLCLMAAIGIAFVYTRSVKAAIAPEIKRILGNTEIKAHPGIDFLERIKEDYEEAIAICDEDNDRRARKLDWSIDLFVIAAIILMIFKVWG